MKKTFFFDLERAAFGTLDLELHGKAGETVEALIGECAANGRIDRAPGGWRCCKRAEIVLREGVTDYPFPIPPFCSGNRGAQGMASPCGEREIAPFRYVEITGELEAAVPHRHEVFPPEFDDAAADFSSSNRALDRVWEFCKYTMKATAPFGVFVDGERERLPYEGDAWINMLGWFCCCPEGGIVRRTLEHLLEHPTWPQEWRLLMPLMAEQYVLYSGDTSVLAGWKEELEKRLMRYAWNPEGLLPARTEEMCNLTPVRTIVDWPKAEQDGCEFGEVMLSANCYLYGALTAMYRLYKEERFLREAEALKKILRRKMLRNGVFTDHPTTDHASVHSLMFPVVFGVAEEAEFPRLGALAAARGMACSVYGAQFLLEMLCRCGRPEAALALMSRSGPRSWLGMMEQGSTITMEAWSNAAKPNQDWNHAWGAAPANIIPRQLCGVRPLSPGFGRFLVAPAPGGLSRFHLVHPTVAGPIVLDYRDGMLEAEFPAGLTAVCAGKEYTRSFQVAVTQK